MAIQSIAKWNTIIARNTQDNIKVLTDVSVVRKRNAQTENISFLGNEKGEINLHHII